MLTFLTAARWRALAIVSAVFGAGVSAYLLVEYSTGQAGVCLTGAGCDLVRDSDFAYPLGIPLPLFGLVFYAVAIWLVSRTVADPRSRPLLVGLSALGALASLGLTGIEAFVIGAFCTWCLAQAFASWVMLLAAVGLATQPVSDQPEGGSSRARQQRARSLEAERSGLRQATMASASLTVVLFATLLVVGAVNGSPSTASPGTNAALAPADAPRVGNGAVTIVEFADFQCPGCAQVAPILYQMASANEMTLVARYFPLNQIHRNADASARAAAAANLQGAYWPMAERLYAEQAAWEALASPDAYFEGIATDLGLDVARWASDYASSEVANTVARDLDAARQLNLPGTPSLFINGSVYDGALTADAIRSAIARAAGG
jgi:protein-disulfide isomerase